MKENSLFLLPIEGATVRLRVLVVILFLLHPPTTSPRLLKNLPLLLNLAVSYLVGPLSLFFSEPRLQNSFLFFEFLSSRRHPASWRMRTFFSQCSLKYATFSARMSSEFLRKI
jgi:hypothetical protein